jgi:hypothetical protein
VKQFIEWSYKSPEISRPGSVVKKYVNSWLHARALFVMFLAMLLGTAGMFCAFKRAA